MPLKERTTGLDPAYEKIFIQSKETRAQSPVRKNAHKKARDFNQIFFKLNADDSKHKTDEPSVPHGNFASTKHNKTMQRQVLQSKSFCRNNSQLGEYDVVSQQSIQNCELDLAFQKERVVTPEMSALSKFGGHVLVDTSDDRLIKSNSEASTDCVFT